MRDILRCGWANEHPEYIPYHDTDWGRPVHEDQRLFEMLSLSCTQAGLSWITMLRRRENYSKAFDGFNVTRIAAYDDEKVEELLKNEGIIRNRRKISAAITNAKAFIRIQNEFGSFDAYLWGFVGGQPIDDLHSRTEDVPARTELSDAISADMKKRGFAFVGTTIICAYMHTVGLMNGHARDCFCRTEDIQPVF